MGDGQTEHMNRTILNMLKTLGEKEKQDWKNHLTKLTFAYNSTTHKTTGFSPCYLMFGRSPRLPIDSIFDIGPDEAEQTMQISYQNYAEEWKRGMNQAFEITKTHARKFGEMNRKFYNKKVYGVEIEIGNRVLLKNLSERGGTGKMRSYWEDRVYVVVEKNSEIPVYTIKPETGKGKMKRVHRNNIMNCNSLVQKEKMPEEDKKFQRCEVKHKQKVVEVQTDSESENEELAVIGRYSSFPRGEEEDCEVIRVVEENEVFQDEETAAVEEADEGDELEVEEVVDKDVIMQEAGNAESEVTEETEANSAGNDGDMMDEIFGKSNDEEEFEGFADDEIDDTESKDDSKTPPSRPQRIRQKPLRYPLRYRRK